MSTNAFGPQGMAELPVIQVTWDGALAYCVHRGMRLPYEVEWEFAARQSPDGRNFPWGCAGELRGRGLCPHEWRALPDLPARTGSGRDGRSG